MSSDQGTAGVESGYDHSDPPVINQGEYNETRVKNLEYIKAMVELSNEVDGPVVELSLKIDGYHSSVVRRLGIVTQVPGVAGEYLATFVDGTRWLLNEPEEPAVGVADSENTNRQGEEEASEREQFLDAVTGVGYRQVYSHDDGSAKVRWLRKALDHDDNHPVTDDPEAENIDEYAVRDEAAIAAAERAIAEILIPDLLAQRQAKRDEEARREAVRVANFQLHARSLQRGVRMLLEAIGPASDEE